MNHPLPDFARLAWASSEARAHWEPIFFRCATAMQQIELLTVSEGIRRCARTTVAAKDFPEWSAKVRQLGLAPVPLRAVAATTTYSNSAEPPRAGGPVSFLAAAVRIVDSVEAYKVEHGEEEGDWLGYPPCCRQFFDEVWPRDHDTTWAMAQSRTRRRRPMRGRQPVGDTIDINEFYKASTLLRWFGVRLVPHLPCAFNCDPSHRMAEQFEAVGRANGFEDEMDAILEALSWPVEWSVLHGIAEIVTPVVKATSRSLWTHEKKTVRMHGRGYPAFGSTGVRFPFRPAGSAVVQLGTPPAPKLWELNGFSTQEGMRAAHSIVVEASRAANLQGVTLMDLGCGNGELLRRLRRAHPGGEVVGVDNNPDAIEDARVRWAPDQGTFEVGDLFLAEIPDETVVVLMPGRFEDAGSDRTRARLAERLAGRTVLAYAYSDWTETGVKKLCEEAGLSGTWHSLQHGVGAEAGLLEVSP